ncbi:MAG: aminotransferase class IV, partial [Parvularculaceae bacterium]|nr:aminotransferase class IV [Parvularculaceae bacterium]
AALAAANGCAQGFAAARVTATRGQGGRGLDVDPTARPTLLVTVAPYAPPTGPAAVLIATRPRWSGAPTAFKAIAGYLDNILARDEARRAGADEALLLNDRGRLAGAAAANLFVIDAASVLTTPSTAEGALAGIVRGVLLEEARAAGLAVREGAVDVETLGAGAFFLSNGLIGLRPAQLLGEAPKDIPGIYHTLEARYRLRLIEEAGGA